MPESPPRAAGHRRDLPVFGIALFAALGVAIGARFGAAAVHVPDAFVNEVIVAGLHQPNSLAFLPDGRVLITEERRGWVRMVVNGHVAATDPLLVVPNLNPAGFERGLHGIAVDPGWPQRPYVYLFHNRTGGKIRLVRYTASGDLADPVGESLTLGSPLFLIDDAPDAGQLHNAGCLRFGPSGHLFVSLGDDEEYCAAADSSSLRGQILRLEVNGLPPGGGGQVARALITPADNPLATADTNARLVWAYGLRNPWRFHVDPASGLLYVADPGESSYEEYNEVHAGGRYGWPYLEGPTVISRALCPEPGGDGASPYESPIAFFPNQSGLSAINAGGIYRAPVGGRFDWPAEYEGSAFFGDYYHGFLRRIVNPGTGWVAASPVAGQPNSDDWATGLTTAVDFLVGPDGGLWWLSQFDSTQADSTGALQRIRPAGNVGVEKRSRPRASLTAAPLPFRSRVILSFALEEASESRLTIHDLTGRRVRLLLEERCLAGERRVAWDGRDDSGRALPPGIYFVHLHQPRGSVTTRILRLR